jgi:hypothetical protein
LCDAASVLSLIKGSTLTGVGGTKTLTLHACAAVDLTCTETDVVNDGTARDVRLTPALIGQFVTKQFASGSIGSPNFVVTASTLGLPESRFTAPQPVVDIDLPRRYKTQFANDTKISDTEWLARLY